jgi:N-acetylglucosaminyl-diphospho-decaprenol L-rhamnosyltransferase
VSSSRLDDLPVVTVTYSPGPHLERFLSSLTLATDLPVHVVMADNGSTDGTPEAAVERFQNIRLLRTGANLGYGGAVNYAVASLPDAESADFLIIANPDVVWGPGSIDALLEAAQRWPRAAAFGPLIRDPDGSVYPSARHLPSLIRGGMHAVVGPIWRRNPWTAAYRQDRLEPSERPVGWLSGSCLLVRRSVFDSIGGFDERYFMYMEDVDLGDRFGKAGWQNVYVPAAEVLHDKGHSTGKDPARNLAAHHTSTYTYLSDRHAGWQRAPLRATMKVALAARARLAVRKARRERLNGGALNGGRECDDGSQERRRRRTGGR